MTDQLEGFTRETFAAGGTTHDIYRAGSGPAVLVLAEMPGITPGVLAFARRVVGLGCTAVLPHLFGQPGRPPSGSYAARSLVEVCISREFSGFALGRSSPVIAWLRALAATEHERCAGPGVGVVGMCYTGGFGLAMTVEDAVVAPVLSQPSLPFALGAARKSRGERLEPRTELIEARGQGLGALFGGVGALALGRRLVAGFGQIVGDGKRGHDDQALIADFPERLAHFANFVVDYAGQRFEAGLLALVAGEAIFAAVDRHRNLRHAAAFSV